MNHLPLLFNSSGRKWRSLRCSEIRSVSGSRIFLRACPSGIEMSRKMSAVPRRSGISEENGPCSLVLVWLGHFDSVPIGPAMAVSFRVSVFVDHFSRCICSREFREPFSSQISRLCIGAVTFLRGVIAGQSC
jgi:hypothetical protein